MIFTGIIAWAGATWSAIMTGLASILLFFSQYQLNTNGRDLQEISAVFSLLQQILILRHLSEHSRNFVYNII